MPTEQSLHVCQSGFQFPFQPSAIEGGHLIGCGKLFEIDY